MKSAFIIALSKSESHTFKKFNCQNLILLEGLGIEGDAHMGKTVKHRSRVKQDPNQPNLRQIHLIHSELFDELKLKGFSVKAGEMGENIATKGIDLLALPKGSKLKIGDKAEITITGLRNPCSQLNGFKKGLMQAVLDKDNQGNLIRKAGVMGIVSKGGIIKIGDAISIDLPELPHQKLEKV